MYDSAKPFFLCPLVVISKHLKTCALLQLQVCGPSVLIKFTHYCTIGSRRQFVVEYGFIWLSVMPYRDNGEFSSKAFTLFFAWKLDPMQR